VGWGKWRVLILFYFSFLI